MAYTTSLVIPTVTTITAFLPALAVRRAGRSWREPAGMAAMAWAAIGLQSVVNVTSYSPFDASLALRTLIVCIGTVLYVVVLLPHTLAWMGRGATRWYWPAVAAWLVACAAAFSVLGASREFRTVMAPISGLVMCFVTGLALAARVKQAPAALGRHEWYWILTGQMLFFSVEIFRKPIVEALMERHWNAMLAVHYGLISMYGVCHVLVAWGILQRAGASPPPTFPPASLASPV